MDVWDAMCRTIMSAGQRRGAMMATMRCDHPDIEEFIAAKADARRLRNFNLSVLVTDAFMAAVREGEPWDLVFDGNVYRTVPAARSVGPPDARHLRLRRARRDLHRPHQCHEQSRLLRDDPATNPCGEQPLPPYGACLLGSINLAALVRQAVHAGRRHRYAKLEQRVATAVRFLDNMIDISHYPLKRRPARPRRSAASVSASPAWRCLDILRSALRQLRPRAHGAPRWMAAIRRGLSGQRRDRRGKGRFPALRRRRRSLPRRMCERLDGDVRAAIARHGIRNGCLTSIAPTGTISLLAGNVSSGIEPVFDFVYTRRVLEAGGRHAGRGGRGSLRYRRLPAHALADGSRRSACRRVRHAPALVPADHLAMQAALQPHVDSAISKTINCPEAMPFEAFETFIGRPTC